MRTNRKNWKGGQRDRNSLLKHSSPPKHNTDASFEVDFPKQEENSIQFVPAYDDVSSPATLTAATEPPTPLSPSPPHPKARQETKAIPKSTLPRKQQGNSKAKTRGMARLASLFSSRATVSPPSPPRSESSTGYVRWPGTQDPKGATVSMPSEEEESDADDYMVQSLANPVAAAASPPRDSKIHRLQDIYGRESSSAFLTEPWASRPDDTLSTFSKTSSAYFGPEEPPRQRALQKNRAAAVMRVTQETLSELDHYQPPHRPLANARGYRGLLDKSKDVPNLLDDDSTQSTHVSSAKRGDAGASDVFANVMDDLTVSDVFDGVQQQYSNSPTKKALPPRQATIPEEEIPVGATPRNEQEANLNVVLLGGGLTTIQTTAHAFADRRTASDYDENLTNSDCDQYGFTRIPGFSEMASAGKDVKDRSLSHSSLLFAKPSARAQQAIQKYNHINNQEEDTASSSSSSLFSDPYEEEDWGQNVNGGLEQYYVHPDEMKRVVRKFRQLSSKKNPEFLDFDEFEREQDATKAFALFEMRSRIMEKDIERGLERRGGTPVVDDIVLTPYHRAALRVRDAVIVAKAWRDGATPLDVINTSLLTRRPERAYYIRRPVAPRGWENDRNPAPPARYTWEEVLWVDDLEMSQYKCHSIGPRNLRGFEMFTIGDCQSILLKLCNQRCLELRAHLNDATGRQIEAEEVMKHEVSDMPGGMMTEAEMTYLSSMEQVKTISMQLVVAEKSFTLVRDRIEKLVAKYEALLVKFENDSESLAPSSIVTASSYYTDYTDSLILEERERDVLARRAQRAELRAELAAREAIMAKQNARALREEKEREIHALRQKLCELQSESSAAIAEREHSVVLARAIAAKNRPNVPVQHASNPPAPSGNNRISASKIDSVKQRFRNRSAARSAAAASAARGNVQPHPYHENQQATARSNQAAAAQRARANMFRAVGEEMFQHLDFYERSLKAVEPSHRS